MPPRKKTTAAKPPPPDVYDHPVWHPLPREPWPPTLRERYGDGSMYARPRPTFLSVRQVMEATWYLPPWQRGPVWTPAQQVAYCEALWAGYAIPPMLVWEVGAGGGIANRRAVLLDGQQRLLAMGARVVHADGSPVAYSAPRVDLDTGRWDAWPDEGPDRSRLTLAEIVDDGDFHRRPWDRWRRDDDAAEVHMRRMGMLRADARGRLEDINMVFYAMENTPPRLAAEYFRGWNIPGTPIQPSDLEALMQRVTDWSPHGLD